MRQLAKRCRKNAIAFQPSAKLLPPPGGARTREVGRSVMTLPAFWFEPDAKALALVGTGCVCGILYPPPPLPLPLPAPPPPLAYAESGWGPLLPRRCAKEASDCGACGFAAVPPREDELSEIGWRGAEPEAATGAGAALCAETACQAGLRGSRSQWGQWDEMAAAATAHVPAATKHRRCGTAAAKR